MSKSPLLGYNNNIPYKGRVFHVQTEDSGTKRPHVITHLFADGGRIVNTTKTSYAHFVGGENLAEKVRALMKEQHRGMVVSLRDGEFDSLIGGESVDGSSAARASSSGATASTPGATASNPGASAPSASGAGGSGAPADEPQISDSNAPPGHRGEPRNEGAGAYKKIVGRATSAPPGSGGEGGSRRPPQRRMAATRPHPSPRGGALFGHAVRAQRSVPPGPPNVEMHSDPFGQRLTSERSLDEVVGAFFGSA